MRISDWSSDVCASDLSPPRRRRAVRRNGACDKDAFGFSFPATVRVAAMHTCNASLSRRARLVYSPAMHLHPLISDTATLEKLCSRLATVDFVAVDTEFMRENTYWPELYLIQIAPPKEAAAIAPKAPALDRKPSPHT